MNTIRWLSLVILALGLNTTRLVSSTLDWKLGIVLGGQSRLEWTAEAGSVYTLQTSDTLSNWVTVPGFPKSGTGSTLSHLFVAVSAGYFKITAEPATLDELVLIPAGWFQMGDSIGDGRSDEKPVFDLYMKPYYIGRYEVTKALWDDVRAWGLTHGYTDLPPGTAKGPNHPVGSMNWHAAVKWCNARSEKEGLKPYYTVLGAVYRTGTVKNPLESTAALGYRLPSEAEWERAARGGKAGHRFPWSDTETITHARANYYSTNSFTFDTSITRGFHPDFNDGVYPYTSPVGSFPANDFGLHDMAGNVYEWCGDWYDSYPSNAGGPPSGTYRLYRGGGWGGTASMARCAYREALSASIANVGLGFRLARNQP